MHMKPVAHFFLSHINLTDITFQGIITSTARLQKFPTPLCSTSEQVYLTGLLHGWGPKDDSAMVRMYTSESVTSVKSTLSPEETTRRIEMVVKAMKYTNIVATAEAVAFARYLDADLTQFYELVIEAAGASKVFKTLGATMIKGVAKGEAPAGSLTVDKVIKELSDIVQEARDLFIPLNLATTALNQYIVAQRRGWGAEDATSVIRVWDDM